MLSLDRYLKCTIPLNRIEIFNWLINNLFPSLLQSLQNPIDLPKVFRVIERYIDHSLIECLRSESVQQFAVSFPPKDDIGSWMFLEDFIEVVLNISSDAVHYILVILTFFIQNILWFVEPYLFSFIPTQERFNNRNIWFVDSRSVVFRMLRCDILNPKEVASPNPSPICTARINTTSPSWKRCTQSAKPVTNWNSCDIKWVPDDSWQGKLHTQVGIVDACSNSW